MFKAIGKYFRAIGYLFTGRVDDARRTLSTNPSVVKATYDRVIEEKTKRIHQYKDAVGAMIAQEEKKKAALKRLTEEVTKLRKLRDGAAAMARKVGSTSSSSATSIQLTRCPIAAAATSTSSRNGAGSGPVTL